MIAGTASWRPDNAATPVAAIAPEIRPPGRCAQRNSRPPAVPMASVSRVINALLRLGRVTAMAQRICLTPPYGKFVSSEQMR
jgi:hypothetical protein